MFSQKNFTKKTIFILLRWIIAFVILLLFIQNEKFLFDSPLTLSILTLYCISAVVLNFVDEEIFEKPWLNYTIFISDILFVSISIYYTGGMDSDFYLVYFLAILMAAIGQNINGSLIISSAASVMYGWITFKSKGSIQYLLDPGFLIRFPFFYIIALSSGFQSQEVKEKQLEIMQIERAKEILEKEIEKATRNLSETNNRLRALTEYNDHILQCITNGLIAIDEKGIVTSFNRSAERILRITSQEIVNKPILSIPFLAILGEKLISTVGEKEIKDEMTINTPLGIPVPLEIRYSVLKDYQNTTIGSLCVFTDLTTEKEMVEELQRSQRLAALGEITAMVAHEIKNPVQAIISISDIANEKTDASNPIKKYTEFILEQSHKLTDIIKSVLSFTKPPALDLKEWQINAIILKVTALLKNFFDKKGIKLDLKLAENLPIEFVDIQKLEEVFYNIVINAIEAVGNNIGVIKIQSFFDDNNIFINFIDNGRGIPPQNLKKVFDPFFSTKPTGTGLGLSLSQKIVEAHEGEIKVWSNQKNETCFQVILPRKGTKK